MSDSMSGALSLGEAVQMIGTHRRLEIALRAHDLTPLGLAMLAYFAQTPESSLTACCRAFGILPTAFTHMIDRLEKRGLVTRIVRYERKGEGDRRMVTLELTDSGRELLANLAVIEVER